METRIHQNRRIKTNPAFKENHAHPLTNQMREFISGFFPPSPPDSFFNFRLGVLEVHCGYLEVSALRLEPVLDEVLRAVAKAEHEVSLRFQLVY